MNPLALISGASGDIGHSIARKLASLNYDLALLARGSEALEAVARDLRREAPGVQIACEICDVGDYTAVKTLFGKLAAGGRQLAVLINCAGIAGGGVTAEVDPQKWFDVINTNLNGTFFVIREALGCKLVASGGRIINIASTGGKQGVLNGAPYSASKHGVVGLTKALGLELAQSRTGITVNAVCPGFVESAMAAKVRANYARLWNTDVDEVKRRIEARIPIGRYVMPDEVAEMVGYLVSPLAAAVTAQALNVCGGLGNY
jgi:ketoreductase